MADDVMPPPTMFWLDVERGGRGGGGGLQGETPLLALGEGRDGGGVGDGILAQPGGLHAAENVHGALPLPACAPRPPASVVY